MERELNIHIVLRNRFLKSRILIEDGRAKRGVSVVERRGWGNCGSRGWGEVR